MTRNILAILALFLLCTNALAQSDGSLLTPTPTDNPKITDAHQKDDPAYEKYSEELRNAMRTADNDDESPVTPNQDDEIISNNDQDGITEAPVSQPETTSTDPSSEEKPASNSTPSDNEKIGEGSPAENSTGLGSLILGICVLFSVIILAFACHYRYQLEKYKIPPFTPPSFCPNFLFPRSYKERSGNRNDAFQMVEVSDYNPPEFAQA